MHHRDECEWVQRREEGEKIEDWKMKISCENSHTGFMGSEFKSLFYGSSLTQDTVQDAADLGTAKYVCRGCVLSQTTLSRTRFSRKQWYMQTQSLNTNKAKLLILFNISYYYKNANLIRSVWHFCFNENISIVPLFNVLFKWKALGISPGNFTP